MGAGPVNTNWGLGRVNTNLGSGPVNRNTGPGPVNTNWEPGSGPGPGGKQRAKGQEIQTPLLVVAMFLGMMAL